MGSQESELGWTRPIPLEEKLDTVTQHVSDPKIASL